MKDEATIEIRGRKPGFKPQRGPDYKKSGAKPNPNNKPGLKAQEVPPNPAETTQDEIILEEEEDIKKLLKELA